MNRWCSICPKTELAEAMQPGNGPFNDVAEDTETAPMCGVSSGEQRPDAACAHLIPVLTRVIGPIGVHSGGALARATHSSLYRRNRINHVQQFLDIGHVR